MPKKETKETTVEPVISVPSIVSGPQRLLLDMRTPAHALKQREGGGGTMLSYVQHGYVRHRLDEAFGKDWDFEMLSVFAGMPYTITQREETVRGDTKKVDYLTVLGRLTVRVHDPEQPREVLTIITKTEFGSQPWRAMMELGDALKSASSDALKRCGLGLGIAADLYYDDEAEMTKFTNRQAILSSLNDPAVPTTLVQFLKLCNEKGLTVEVILDKLHLTHLSEIKDFAAAWGQVSG